MSKILKGNYEQMRLFAQNNNFQIEEKEENGYKRMEIKKGSKTCVITVYANGKLLIQGKDSKLKETLWKLKKIIENGENTEEMLPFDIKDFPNIIQTNIENIDPVIIHYLKESIKSVESDSNIGSALLLASASEKAIYLLLEAYQNAIIDEEKKQEFINKISNKFISEKFEEFKNSLKQATENIWSNDIELKIQQIVQLCSICRDEKGHPYLVSDLHKSTLIESIGEFVKYIQDIYKLIEYYNTNKVEF